MLKRSIYRTKIPPSLYRKIVESMPVPCVDVVLKSGNRVFLFKRAYEPAKNKWWLIGGRILKGETFKEAVKRKVKEEVGIEAKLLKMIGVYEEFFVRSRFDGNEEGKKNKNNGTHTLSVCFVAEPIKKDFRFTLNNEYRDYKIINRIEKGLDPYVKRVLRDSGIKFK
ncbi:NUDIX domain-containing protein [Candidatus Woesearchaeota archaeon]|nr:NUDIX domain-containing protein [Candidatus Woesearchaeota archaeon]